MQRLPFLRAKSADARSLLAWAEAELQRLRPLVHEYDDVIDLLMEVIDEGRRYLSRLDPLITAIQGSGNVTLVPRAMELVHLLEGVGNLVAVSYLPALQRQGESDRFVRGLVLCAARAGGLTWMRNVVARLDGAHAAMATIPHIPIIYAPPRHDASLIDLPGLYHELGHAVHAREEGLDDALGRAVHEHFNEQRHHAGQLLPGQQANRQAEISSAEGYWTKDRRAELFCDVFATVVCGPAHYVSFADLGLRHHEDPFAIIGRAHPPNAARVRACYAALPAAHRQEPLVVRVAEAWTAHESAHTSSQEYERACATDLISSLVQVARAEISRLLPKHTPYSKPLPVVDALETIDPGASLEDLLNQAASVLLMAPDRYALWEPRAMEAAKQLSAEAAKHYTEAA